jgi:uncharacterized protein (DUF697 family)
LALGTGAATGVGSVAVGVASSFVTFVTTAAFSSVAVAVRSITFAIGAAAVAAAGIRERLSVRVSERERERTRSSDREVGRVGESE